MKTSPSRSHFKKHERLFKRPLPRPHPNPVQRRVLWARLIQTGRESFYQRRNSTKKGEIMKKMLLSIALAVVASFVWGQTTRQPLMKTEEVQQQPQRTTTTTTTTTEGTGTITEYTPGSAIVLRESSGPRTYRFGKTVTYVTRSGKVLDEDTVRTRVKVGVPVRVHYVGTGTNIMVDRVILEED